MDLTKIRPLADRLVVKELPREERVGSLFIPQTASDQHPVRRAEVVAVGPGRVTDSGKLIEPRVKTGDKVLFGKYSGSEIKVDGEELLIMREEDILGVVEG